MFCNAKLPTRSAQRSEAASRGQSWSLDALGNFSSLTTDGTTRTRSHNCQNQITSIQTETTPTCDNNGDTTKDNAGQQYTFDACNHLHVVKNAGGTTLVTYSYDATYRRISEAPASEATMDLYYSASWQVVEDRQSTHSSIAYQQYVWSPVYVDCMILRDRDTNADGTLDERLYCLQDANFNVTSTLTAAGAIQERYRYDPYGAVTYLDSSFNSHASAYAWQYLHQGGRLDLVSGLYCFRNRDLHTALGRWMQEDPLGYVDGRSLYQSTKASPCCHLDPHGASDDVWPPEWVPDVPPGWPGQAGPPPLGPALSACLEAFDTCTANAPPSMKPFCYVSAAACFKKAGLPRFDPLPSWSPKCDDYGCTDTYSHSYARCFCKKAPNDPWSQSVRGCLRALYDLGVDPDTAHHTCYAYATAQGFQMPLGQLLWVWYQCNSLPAIGAPQPQ